MSDLDKQLTTDVAGSGETPAPVAEVSESVETKVPETEQEYRDFLASVGVSVRKKVSMEALVTAYEAYQQSQMMPINDGQASLDERSQDGADAFLQAFPISGVVHNKTISDYAFPELGKQPARFIESGGSAVVKFDNADQLNTFQLNAEKLRVLNGWKAGVGIILELEGA